MNDFHDWAKNFALETVPQEAKEASELFDQYIRVHTYKQKPFIKKDTLVAHIPVDYYFSLLPILLSAVSNPEILSFLKTVKVLDVLSLITELLDIKDRLVRKKKADAISEAMYRDLKKTMEIINTTLRKANMSEEEAELLTYRIIKALITDKARSEKVLELLNRRT